MKTLFAFSLILPLIGGVFYTKSSGKNHKPEGGALYYEYRYSGTMAYPFTYYQVEKDASGQVTIAWLKKESPDVVVIKAPQEVLEHIGALAYEHNESEIDRTLEAARKALKKLAKLEDS